MLVQVTQLDTLLDLAGEIIIVSANLESLNRLVQATNAVPNDVVDGTKELSSTSTRISSDLHKLVVDVRNVELGDMFARFRRLVRDTSRRLGKLVELHVEGEDISLDKRIAERIHDPIAHQLRNAIAHGIEDEATRLAAGKSAAGQVSIRVRLLDACIRIEVSDDGQGVDENKVRQTAIARGLLSSKEAEAVSKDELLQLLYLPGFSTQNETTTTAGRGVGMDVIRNTLLELDGDVTLKTEAGLGTSLILELPKVSAVNILDALLVRAGSDVYAFPLSAVLSSATAETADFVSILGSALAIQYRGAVLPVFDLLEVFGRRGKGEVHYGTAVNLLLVEHKGKRAGFIIDEFVRPQKLVLTPFEGTLEVPAISGSAVLAGRKLAMIVDVPQLLELSRGEPAQPDAVRQVHREESMDAVNEPIANESLELPSPHEQPLPAATVSSTTDAELSLDSSSESYSSKKTVAFDTSALNFLREQEGLLAKLNIALLSLDDNRDAETTDLVFRLAHSVKGNFAMCGLETAANLTHSMETVLDQARQSVSALTDNSFDALFDGCSHLEALTTELLAGRLAPEPTAELLQALSRLTASTPVLPSRAPGAELSLTTAARFLLSDTRNRGLRVHHVKIQFGSTEEPEFLIAYLLLRQLQKQGEVLVSSPSLDTIATGQSGSSLQVLLALSSGGKSRLEAQEAGFRRHYGVTTLQVERAS